MDKVKMCTGPCGLEKTLDNFPIRKDTKKHTTQCFACKKEKSKKYREDNKKRIKEDKHIYYETNKERLLEKFKNNYIVNKDHILIQSKEYRRNNKEKRNKYEKDKKKSDPSYKLRKSVSNLIRMFLKSNNSSKGNKSSLKYLPYTIDDLKEHIESLFESWMAWDNYGKYSYKDWDDNDQSTWVWNIDHITPQSDLPYVSMEDDNFKICWSLSNLRPLSAKQNTTDGANRARHKKK